MLESSWVAASRDTNARIRGQCAGNAGLCGPTLRPGYGSCSLPHPLPLRVETPSLPPNMKYS